MKQKLNSQSRKLQMAELVQIAEKLVNENDTLKSTVDELKKRLENLETEHDKKMRMVIEDIAKLKGILKRRETANVTAFIKECLVKYSPQVIGYETIKLIWGIY